MKQFLFIGLVAALAAPTFAAKKETATAPAAKVEAPAAGAPSAQEQFDQKVSYAMGMQLGMQMAAALKDTSMRLSPDAVLAGAKEASTKESGYVRSYMAGLQSGGQMAGLQKEGVIKLQWASFEKAFRDGLTGDSNKLGMKDAEFAQVMGALEDKVRMIQARKIEDAKKKNLTEGATFLAENKSKAGVVTTASGLQYKVLADGTGPVVAIGDSLKVHYTGKLLDGTTFDSSVDRGQPFEFVLSEGGLIKGWIELLQLLKAGSKVTTWIPENLAYGDQGSQPVIGPNAALQFEIEVISVKKPEAKPAANKPAIKKK